jgi:hypothetical protein
MAQRIKQPDRRAPSKALSYRMLKGFGIPGENAKQEDYSLAMRALVAKRADIVFDIKTGAACD